MVFGHSFFGGDGREQVIDDGAEREVNGGGSREKQESDRKKVPCEMCARDCRKAPESSEVVVQSDYLIEGTVRCSGRFCSHECQSCAIPEGQTEFATDELQRAGSATAAGGRPALALDELMGGGTGSKGGEDLKPMSDKAVSGEMSKDDDGEKKMPCETCGRKCGEVPGTSAVVGKWECLREGTRGGQECSVCRSVRRARFRGGRPSCRLRCLRRRRQRRQGVVPWRRRRT